MGEFLHIRILEVGAIPGHWPNAPVVCQYLQQIVHAIQRYVLAAYEKRSRLLGVYPLRVHELQSVSLLYSTREDKRKLLAILSFKVCLDSQLPTNGLVVDCKP